MRESKILFRVLFILVTVLMLLGLAVAKEKEAAIKSPPAGKVDLNTASQKQLEDLPGIGSALAKKIITGRPYSSPADLSKAGIPAKTIEKITPLVTVGTAPAVTAPATKAAPLPKKEPAPAVATTPPPPGKGMVWVNTETKVFHREGDYWYGKTKKGQYMTEADALKAGNREAKSKKKKESQQ